tara:strand:- start:1308 stop:1868 length:561 start_codon:yes stop_codon:yes gene_type:complete
MTRILAFGASSSKNSINKKLASFVVERLEPVKATIIDLNDFEMPIYSEDREKEDGIPEKALNFKRLIRDSNGIVISLAEHNGSYTSAFKNIYDWISVIEKVVWDDKPLFLLSASDGKRGGLTILNTALKRFSMQSKYEIPNFSLPNFNENFSDYEGILNSTLRKDFEIQISNFKKQVESLLNTQDN